jgi:hypothetical protein
MAGEIPFTITRTAEAEDIAVCATMMSLTDPWLSYTMGYDLCLKAFDGECKEIYVLEKNKEVVGFVILQVCGTFRGYIQTFRQKTAAVLRRKDSEDFTKHFYLCFFL